MAGDAVRDGRAVEARAVGGRGEVEALNALGALSREGTFAGEAVGSAAAAGKVE